MELIVERVDYWVASLPDRPGELASVLGILRDANANLLSIVARRDPGEDGKALVYVSPLESDHEIRAATQVGFNVAHSLHGVRVIGRDGPGIAAQLTQRLADAGINLSGLSVSVIGLRFAAYFALDTQADADRAIEILSRPILARAA